MTLSYGVAQIIAPAITGWLATRFGSYNAGLYLAAAVMVVGTVLLLVLKPIEKRDAARSAASPWEAENRGRGKPAPSGREHLCAGRERHRPQSQAARCELPERRSATPATSGERAVAVGEALQKAARHAISAKTSAHSG